MLFHRNVFKPYKLLSIDPDGPLPHVDHVDLPVVEVKDIVGPDGLDQISGPTFVQDRSSVFPVLAFLGTGLVVLFLFNQYYRTRSRPRRKRPRARKLLQLNAGRQVPGV